MKKTLLMAGALLALTAGIASAQSGINLSWNDCGGAGTGARTFACTTNAGTPGVLICSAVAGVAMPQLNGQASVLDVQTNQAALSQWWHLETGGCRSVALVVSFDFTTGPFTCLDAWGGQAVGGINFQPDPIVLNRGRIKTVCAVNPPVAIDGTDEYYFEKVTLLNSKTVGNGSCAGCTDGACIVFNQIQLTQPTGFSPVSNNISTPILRQFVTYQAGGAGIGGGCPGAVPTRSSTWGSVKSLYR